MKAYRLNINLIGTHYVRSLLSHSSLKHKCAHKGIIMSKIQFIVAFKTNVEST